MLPIDINYFAVLVAAIVNQAIGFFWYSDAGFGKYCRVMMGFDDPKKMEEMKSGMGKMMIYAFIASLIMAYVLAHFVDLTGATTFGAGLQLGFWAWLGFTATVQLGAWLWEQKPFKLYILNTTYWLTSLLIMGGLLAAWQ